MRGVPSGVFPSNRQPETCLPVKRGNDVKQFYRPRRRTVNELINLRTLIVMVCCTAGSNGEGAKGRCGHTCM